MNTFPHPLGAPLKLPTDLLPSETRRGWRITGTRGEGISVAGSSYSNLHHWYRSLGRGGCPPVNWYTKMAKKHFKNEHSTTIYRGLFLTDSGRIPSPRGEGMRMGGRGASRSPFQQS